MAQEERSEVSFMSINQFKDQVEATEISVLKNPKTGKLFMSANGETYKVQQDINPKEEMRILVPKEGGLEEACLVNVSGGAEEQFTL